MPLQAEELFNGASLHKTEPDLTLPNVPSFTAPRFASSHGAGMQLYKHSLYQSPWLALIPYELKNLPRPQEQKYC